MTRRHSGWIMAMVITFVSAEGVLAEEARTLTTDVCVVGGGSGGIGAAIGAARSGVNVLLIERQRRLGGTSTNAYVCNWEPGPGDALAREIYDRLRKRRNAVGVVRRHKLVSGGRSFGLWLPVQGLTYEQSLRRTGHRVEHWRAVAFEPDAMAEVVSEMLAETGKCRVMLGTSFVEAKAEGKRLVSIKAVADDGTTYRVRARVFVDCTGGAHVCRAVGCETMLGPEPASRFGEPSAPQEPGKTLNAISLCYRVRKSDNPARQPEPDPPVKQWPRSAHVTGLPNGDRIINPLAMLPGRALVEMGYDKALARCRRIAAAHWRWLQGYPAFTDYELHSVASMLGIRESYRVVGEYVLTQHDLLAGLDKQTHPDMIAIADHSMDVHGAGGRRVHGELKGPYGIPYRCLVPKGWQNLLVACRGASFSHIAASSCRLSRTMIAVGRAAGFGAAMAVRSDVPVLGIDIAKLKAKLPLVVAEPTQD